MQNYDTAVQNLQKQQVTQANIGDYIDTNYSILQSTKDQLQKAKMEVERLTELLDLLERNPEIQRIMQLISYRGF